MKNKLDLYLNKLLRECDCGETPKDFYNDDDDDGIDYFHANFDEDIDNDVEGLDSAKEWEDTFKPATLDKFRADGLERDEKEFREEVGDDYDLENEDDEDDELVEQFLSKFLKGSSKLTAREKLLNSFKRSPEEIAKLKKNINKAGKYAHLYKKP